MLALKASKSTRYHLERGEGNSVQEIIECCRKVTDNPTSTVEKAQHPGDPPVLIDAAGKIRNELGWHPCYRGIRDIIESVRIWKSKFPFGYQGSNAPLSIWVTVFLYSVSCH